MWSLVIRKDMQYMEQVENNVQALLWKWGLTIKESNFIIDDINSNKVQNLNVWCETNFHISFQCDKIAFLVWIISLSEILWKNSCIYTCMCAYTPAWVSVILVFFLIFTADPNDICLCSTSLEQRWFSLDWRSHRSALISLHTWSSPLRLNHFTLLASSFSSYWRLLLTEQMIFFTNKADYHIQWTLLAIAFQKVAIIVKLNIQFI
jgi:hypothetical protein